MSTHSLPGWIATAWCPLLRRNREWQHPCIVGAWVRHCGHPTALRPYHSNILQQKFRTLRQAQEAVEQAVREELAQRRAQA